MTTETIENISWDDVREGDIVTCEKGTPGHNGHFVRTALAIIENGKLALEGSKSLNSPNLSVEYLEWVGSKVVSIERETLPDHPGALAFLDGEMLFHANTWIDDTGSDLDLKHAPNPVEALPVPAKELRELMDLMKKNPTLAEVNWDTTALIDATRREWERAGINENNDRGE